MIISPSSLPAIHAPRALAEARSLFSTLLNQLPYTRSFFSLPSRAAGFRRLISQLKAGHSEVKQGKTLLRFARLCDLLIRSTQ
jgi:hypothetical protein